MPKAKTAKNPRAKSPRNGNTSTKKKKRKHSYHRTVVSDDVVLHIDTQLMVNSKMKNKKKSKTPGTDLEYALIDFDEDDPFNLKRAKTERKKGRPKSTREHSNKGRKRRFSDDLPPELFHARTFDPDAKSKSTANAQRRGQRPLKLTNSKSIASASKSLSDSARDARRRIGDAFSAFHDALDEQHGRLLEDLELLHEEKKQELESSERRLKRAKRGKEISFQPQLSEHVVLDEDANLKLIGSQQFGYIDFGEGAPRTAPRQRFDFGRITSNDWDEGDETPAMRQKRVLAELQRKTMSSLDAVIEMEKLAKRKKKEAQRLHAELEEKLEYVAARQREVNEQMGDALPMLRKVKLAIECIEPGDLNEIKSMKRPPPVVKMVITAAAMVLGHKIKEWKDVRKILGRQFKPQLLNFDTLSLKKETRRKVEREFLSKEDFNYDRVSEGSTVCAGLVLWVLYQIKYSHILDRIGPLEKELRKLKKEVDRKQKLEGQLLAMLGELEDQMELYTVDANQMIDRIIKTTDRELKQFNSKLAPLHRKFYEQLRQSETGLVD